jgi:NADPH:quinone reductase-like Zn-dependent oxidoreductase
MKALVLTKDVRKGDPGRAFELQEMPMPVAGKDEIVIKVSHFGLNYADVMSRRGLYADRPELPVVLGYEVVGEVVEAGADVSNVQVGDTVLALTPFGGYAEYAKTQGVGAIRLAPGTDPAEATALATQYCTAWIAACHMVHLKKGDKVLVHAAAGGVGTALVQIAKWKGCEVYGTASRPEKMEYLKELGVDHPINYREKDFVAEIQRLSDSKHIDVAFDPIGGKNFKKTFGLLGSGGRVVTFGASEWSSSEGNFFDKIKIGLGFGIFHPIGLLMKSKGVIGVNMLRLGTNKPDYVQAAMNEVYEQYQAGVLKPTVDSVHDASEIGKAHARLEGRGSIGKLVVKW